LEKCSDPKMIMIAEENRKEKKTIKTQNQINYKIK